MRTTMTPASGAPSPCRSGDTEDDELADLIQPDRSVVHGCPSCGEPFAKGFLAPDSALFVVCAKCRASFTYPPGVRTRDVDMRVFNKCKMPKRNGPHGRTCGRTWSQGLLGQGSELEVKCKRCHVYGKLLVM